MTFNERVDDIICMSPLHFKLNFNQFFKSVVDPSRRIVHYDTRKNEKLLTDNEQQIEMACSRIKQLMLALETPVEHNGTSSNWQGNQVSTMFSKVTLAVLLLL